MDGWMDMVDNVGMDGVRSAWKEELGRQFVKSNEIRVATNMVTPDVLCVDNYSCF